MAVKISQDEYIDELRKNGRNIVGTFVAGADNFLIPDDPKMPNNLDVNEVMDRGQALIPTTISGLKVVARFHENTDRVNVIEVIGSAEKVGNDVLSIIRSYNLYEEFSNEAIFEAKKVSKIGKDEIKRREDLRGKMIFTIDPADAKDLDDAVNLDKNPDGTYELGVHIADVSYYVHPDGEIENEAYQRGTSVYFPGGVIPMLPRELSNGICSLNGGEDRLTLSAFMTIDKFGNVIKTRFAETVINTAMRFSYEEVQTVLDGDKDAMKTYKKFVDVINDMAELTKTLEGIRRARGEVVLDVPEPKIVLDEKTGKIADVVAYPHLLSHRIIETFMIMANEAVAEFMHKRNIPCVYRVHAKPDPVKVTRLANTLRPFGLSIRTNNPNGFDYMRLLVPLNDDTKKIVSGLVLRSMQKAKYDPECIGHFGLGSKYYCHFTSPIRRYPDLCVHRILKDVINDRFSTHSIFQLQKTVEDASLQSSRTELVATEVEREVDDLKRAEYMQDHIGEKFTGTISGVMDFGVFVYLPNTVEGLVRIENLPKTAPKEFYTYNEKTGTMSSRVRTFKMGDKIDVTCVGVNMSKRQIDFSANVK